jgi:hypothetical protein
MLGALPPPLAGEGWGGGATRYGPMVLIRSGARQAVLIAIDLATLL